MESNHTKCARSEFTLVSEVSKSYRLHGIKQIEFGKVKHCFSLFHTNPCLTGNLTQLQNRTVHVE